MEHRTLVDVVGRTPLLRLGRSLPPGSAEVLLKLEKRNPGGSLRDRVVRFAFDLAVREDRLPPKARIVAAAGEDGAYSAALLCAARAHPLTVFVPSETTRPERRRAAERFGAKVVVVPGTLDDARAAAEADAAGTKACVLDIESAPIATRACAEIGVEIIEAVDEGGIDAFVGVVRSGGTVEGVGGVLHARFPQMAVQPVRLEGFTRAEAHGMVDVTRAQAHSAAEDLARLEGLLVGPASGAAFFVARRTAQAMGAGKRIVALCTDSGERHL